jgi:hypothetical protein
MGASHLDKIVAGDDEMLAILRAPRRIHGCWG